jgi:hypothetical protein
MQIRCRASENRWGKPADGKPEQDGEDGHSHASAYCEEVEDDKGEGKEYELVREEIGH